MATPSKKAAAAQPGATQAAAATTAEDDESFIATVVNVYGRAGTGGDVNVCKVLVEKTARTIYRTVQGPVAVGHQLALREYVRESRRTR